MRSIERAQRRCLGICVGLVMVGALEGCSQSGPGPRPGSATPATTAPVPAAPRPATPPTASTPRAPAAPVAAPRNWDEFRLHAARRLVAANPAGTYMGVPPEPLLAIPVLEIELNADGGVRRIEVSRYPGQARDTVQLAVDAVRRAAPFGDVSRLPRPWKFTEVFLFDNERRFKPRTLD